MRYISAGFIYSIHQPPVQNGVLVLDDSGKILELLDPGINEIPSSLSIEKFEGIICPGFVNTHCHIELSHLKGRMSQKKTLPFFISEIVEKRNDETEKIIDALALADEEMFQSGISVVGDIANSSVSLNIKKASKIFYHTF